VYEHGKYSSYYFNRNGDLRHIPRLRMWPLETVLQEKYSLPEAEVGAECEGYGEKEGWPAEPWPASHASSFAVIHAHIPRTCCLALTQANSLASFLKPMLEFDPERRATAQTMLAHPWLRGDLTVPAAAGGERRGWER
jgi:serine/threonine-protein kinase SRPK3